jgi:hypothetical protein
VRVTKPAHTKKLGAGYLEAFEYAQGACCFGKTIGHYYAQRISGAQTRPARAPYGEVMMTNATPFGENTSVSRAKFAMIA